MVIGIIISRLGRYKGRSFNGLALPDTNLNFATFGIVPIVLAIIKRTKQTRKMKGKYIATVFVLYVLVNALSYVLHYYIPAYSIMLLMGGNLFMAVISVISYLLIMQQIGNRPEAFVRGVFAGTFIKILLCMFGILIYIMLHRQDLYKPSIFVLFGIYAIYTYAETTTLFKIAKTVK
jgi:hypothetical protein